MSTLFASILNWSVMLGSFLQQMTPADNILRCFFSWRFKGERHVEACQQTVNIENTTVNVCNK